MSSFNSRAIEVFKETSVLFVPGLVSPDLCLNARQYIVDNEASIIKKYSSDKRGLVCEYVNDVCFIKYFEYPLHYDPLFFGRLTTSILNAASSLLEEDVRFVSADTFLLSACI